MRIALVIPHRREEELIEGLMTSVARMIRECDSISVYLVGSVDDSPSYKTRVGMLAESFGLPSLRRIEAIRGIGIARDTACRQAIRDHHGGADSLWLLNTEADCDVSQVFATGWIEALTTSRARVVTGEIELVESLAAPNQTGPSDDILRIARTITKMQRVYESFVGPINTSGQNFAIRADAYIEVGGFRTAMRDECDRAVLGAGEDWELGARCRSLGVAIANDGPKVAASARRLLIDPTGFLTGRAYEGEFVATDDLDRRKSLEYNTRIRSRIELHQRLHYLIKPILLDKAFRDWLIPCLPFGDSLARWCETHAEQSQRQFVVSFGLKWSSRLDEEAKLRASTPIYPNYVASRHRQELT